MAQGLTKSFSKAEALKTEGPGPLLSDSMKLCHSIQFTVFGAIGISERQSVQDLDRHVDI